MYKSLNKNECWALGSGTEGMKRGQKVNQHDWLLLVRQRYQGVSYWVVPWGATQAKAGVEAEPDDGRWLGVIILVKAVPLALGVTSGGRNRYYSQCG